ncbi:MAG: hypothetical protein LBK67_07370 [Coriobacteriales bacterium]|jgi:hypothetical protein|nr:hypothetical protein [Coriobacteriales bacterium]
MTEIRRIPQGSKTGKSLIPATLAFAAKNTLTFALAFVLTLLPITRAFAAGGEDILVTSYSITKGSTAHYTGALNKGDQVTLTLDVSDTRSFLSAYTSRNPPSPGARLNTSSFTISGQDDIRVTKVSPSGSAGWNYTVVFSNLTYTGIGQDFRADIFYPAVDGAPLFPYTQTISQCVPWTEPSGEPASEPTSTPASASALDSFSEPPTKPTVAVKGTGFVIESYDYGNDTIYAGKPFTLALTWLATNGASTLENVTVGLTPSQEITLAKGTNLVYIGTVKPGVKIPISYELLPGAAINEGSYTIAIDAKGIDATSGSEISAQASVTVPVLQPERFSILKSALPTELTLEAGNDAGYGSVTLINQGRTPASNVFVEVVGKGVELKDGKQYFGTINSGEQKTADFNLTASERGTVKAQVVVTYENARGEAKELTQDFTVNVREAEAEPALSIEEQEGIGDTTETSFPWWIVALIALMAVLALIIGLTVWNRKRKASQQEKLLADDWEDEDGEYDENRADVGGVGGVDDRSGVDGAADRWMARDTRGDD